VDTKNERNFDGPVDNEQVLVERVLSGDTTAFRQIIKITQGLVAQIIFKMVNNAEDRLDITQDVYLKVFKNLSGFKFQSKLSTWIARISYTTCLNFLQKKKLVLVDNVYDEDQSVEELEKLSSDKELTDKIENTIDQNERKKILLVEIDKLSPVYKTLIILFHNEELSYSEISEITQLPEGTVKNYLYRARIELKKNLLINYKKQDL
jgi:RNA polymerase sigma-70 factor (ECF subfamily)